MHKFKDLLYSNWEHVVTVAGKRRNGFIQGRHELSCYYCGRKVKTGRRFDAKGPIVLGGDFCNMDRRICAFPRTGRREFGLASLNSGGLVWKGRVLVASVDGRLHALDAGSGKELWVADTIVDHALHSSAGAVYIAGDIAVIGNSGAEKDKGAVRGYVSAYEIETGPLAWRFYTVPGPRIEYPRMR